MKIKPPSNKFRRAWQPASRKWLCLAVVLFTAGRSLKLLANPAGMTVRLGTATPQTSGGGAQLNLTVSQVAFLNWNSFNIPAGETTTFLQPSANSVVLNEIGGANPSQIFGNLNANGTVILANANGFFFGPNSMIKVGGDFIATTAPITPDFGSGSSWTFTGMPALKTIINHGSIQVGNGRSLFLIAEIIENDGDGVLNAPGGNIGLVAGQTVLVSERPDGRGLSASVQVPAGSVNNLGQITADAGTIALQAQVVNQNGIIQANSVQNQNGFIELVASDQLNLGASSQIIANGDNASSGSSGGSVILKSGNTFGDEVGSQVSVTGGAQGGNGGDIEISAPCVQSLNSGINARAQTGWTAGKLLLDPDYIILDTSGTGSAGAGTVSAGDNPGTTLDLNVNKAFANLAVSQIILQAAYDITLASGTSWNLSGTIGKNLGGVTSGQLTLEAGGNIYFGNRSLITDANNWSVALDAGYNFVNKAVQSGGGSIYLGDVVRDSSGKPKPDSNKNLTPANGSGSIQMASGNINLTAGGSVVVGTGFVRTTAGGTTGGNIDVEALAGDIVVGTKNSGVQNSGYEDDVNGNWNVSSSLGGISTMSGGNVTLDAVNGSINPNTRTTFFGVSGAFGSDPGNVTLIAGNQIFGTFNVANGVGTILAGVTVANNQATIENSGANVGSSSQPVSLQLAHGSWNVWAANNVYIGEVRNPAGTFDSGDSFPFNYSSDAAANFWAGNGITLLGQNLPRADNDSTMPPIYAPQLSLNAGAGGITIDSPIILAPSKAGSLHITTRAGGDLIAVDSDVSNPSVVTMSDSDSPDWNTFASGQAAAPLHASDPNPVTLDISGSIYNFNLVVPTFAKINVVGDTYNFGFFGENLRPNDPNDVTIINVGQTAKDAMEKSGLLNSATDSSLRVGGDIVYPDSQNQASVPLSEPLPAELLDPTITGQPEIAALLAYNPATGTLACNGQMTASEINFLLHPTDSSGRPLVDANNAPVTLSAAQLAAVQILYADSQSVHGLALSGFNQFQIAARNIDLGISDGITVDFPNAPDNALTTISPYGADINVTTSGNLDMTATKIANGSLFGGITLNVGVDAGGILDVGGTATALGSANAPKGIFTTSGGNINVTAGGDVNVNGSRIAAYNGGNVTVESLNGNVNAGSGGQGFVILQALQLDPVTGQLNAIGADIPFSGILATTVFGSHASLGNVLVETPNGNFSASQGGVIQISFNGTDASKATVELLAGYELQDANGNRVSAANLTDGTAVRISDNRNIDASGSGVIAQNLILKATGLLSGLFVNFAPTPPIVVANGWGPGPTVFVGPAPPTISGIPSDSTGPDPIIISDNGSTAPPSAEVAKTDAPIADTADTVTTKTENPDDDLGDNDLNQKKGKGIMLAQKTGRVTVILPPKQQPPKAQTPDPRT
jgi:filamentous hemagglutinin family protein